MSPGYDDVYRDFESPLTRQLRLEAYGTDIGQHSWVTADELRSDLARLELSAASRLLDLGCGPCGPLTFAMSFAGCHGVGVDVSAPALSAGRARAAALGVDARIELHQLDLNDPLPFAGATFDVVMSLDVLLHLRDRQSVFRDIARVLVPGGRFLLADAGVLAGPMSKEEMDLRSIHGPTQLVPAGVNERALTDAGFHVVYTEDRTANVLANATGRLTARLAHQREIEARDGKPAFQRQRRYLETVVALSRRGALTRVVYLSRLAPQRDHETPR